MIKFKKLEIENFLSIGNNKQVLNFENDQGNLNLIMGENLDDMSSGISRNGVGKTTILQALYYAIYGISINNNIKKDNLINKINKKNMKVCLEFEKDNVLYRIERGRKPNILNWYVNNKLINNGLEVVNDDIYSNTMNEVEDSRNTQKEINKVIKISPNLFKYIIILNTNTESFLSLPFNIQRDLIEDLLGIKEISHKAEILKEKIKITEDLIKEEERNIYVKIEQNKKIENKIKELEIKKINWDKENKNEILKLKENLKKYKNFDLEKEYMMFELKKYYEEIEKELKNFENKVLLLDEKINFNKIKIDSLRKEKEDILKKIEDMDNEICPICLRKIDEDHNDHIKNIKNNMKNSLECIENSIKELLIETKKLNEEKNKILKTDILENQKNLDEIKEVLSNYKFNCKSIDELSNIKLNINDYELKLIELENKVNPYDEQIKNLNEMIIKDISYEYLNSLKNVHNVQKQLLKFLTNKDSFIRTRLIEQNLTFLNKQLKIYTKMLNMQYDINFRSDLSVDIKQFDFDYDFENLSRGEKTRLTLALNWAFRDLYESFNESTNLMFIDELIDNGLDNVGIELAIDILKKFSIEGKKNIYVISNREDLISRIDNIIYIVKENGFSKIL